MEVDQVSHTQGGSVVMVKLYSQVVMLGTNTKDPSPDGGRRVQIKELPNSYRNINERIHERLHLQFYKYKRLCNHLYFLSAYVIT